jgi:hypothetical protein
VRNTLKGFYLRIVVVLALDVSCVLILKQREGIKTLKPFHLRIVLFFIQGTCAFALHASTNF